MNESVTKFVIRRDPDASVWVVQRRGGRVYARSRFKETALDIGRQIAKRKAPSIMVVYNESGRKGNVVKYGSRSS